MRTTFGGARPWVGILATSVVVAQCLIGAASPTGATPAAAPVPTEAAPKPSPEPTGEGRELVDRRTETSSTFTTGTPGVFHTVTYTRPVHVRQADGTWADIDQTLLPAGGRFHTAGTADGVTVGGTSADASLGQLKLDAGHSLSFAAASASGKPAAINGSKVRYAGLWPDVDLELNAANRGLKETIVLDSPAVPDVYTFPLRLTGLTASIDAAGNVIYRDEAGVERARTPHGIMEDSAVPRVGEGALSVGVSYSLVSQPGHGQALQVRLDRSWLNDPARVYPVRVDPTYWDSTTLQDDTYVMSGFSRDNASDAELKVGTYDGGSHVGISFMNFDVSGLSGMAIDSATFSL